MRSCTVRIVEEEGRGEVGRDGLKISLFLLIIFIIKSGGYFPTFMHSSKRNQISLYSLIFKKLAENQPEACLESLCISVSYERQDGGGEVEIVINLCVQIFFRYQSFIKEN